MSSQPLRHGARVRFSCQGCFSAGVLVTHSWFLYFGWARWRALGGPDPRQNLTRARNSNSVTVFVSILQRET